MAITIRCPTCNREVVISDVATLVRIEFLHPGYFVAGTKRDYPRLRCRNCGCDGEIIRVDDFEVETDRCADCNSFLRVERKGNKRCMGCQARAEANPSELKGLPCVRCDATIVVKIEELFDEFGNLSGERHTAMCERYSHGCDYVHSRETDRGRPEIGDRGRTGW